MSGVRFQVSGTGFRVSGVRLQGVERADAIDAVTSMNERLSIRYLIHCHLSPVTSHLTPDTMAATCGFLCLINIGDAAVLPLSGLTSPNFLAEPGRKGT